MPFRDWADVEASDLLELPINGKKYRIPALGHLDAIRLREDFARVRNGEPSDLSNDEFLQLVLGDQRDAMRADNVPEKAIVHAGTVAYADAMTGRAAAEQLWEHGPDPEALAAAMKEFAAASSTTSPGTPPPTPTSSTKRPASSRSTNSRKRAPRTTGTKSSPILD